MTRPRGAAGPGAAATRRRWLLALACAAVGHGGQVAAAQVPGAPGLPSPARPAAASPAQQPALATPAPPPAAAASGHAEAAHLAPVRRWMQVMHDEWALPRYVRLNERAQALAAAVAQACAGPGVPASAPAAPVRAGTPPALAAAQRTWRDTMQVWRQLEALQLGPTLARRTSKTIDFWPTRPAVIDKAVQMTAGMAVSGPEAEQAMQQWGTAAKGLPALEWLLFPAAGAAAPLMQGEGHCRYAQRISLALAGETALLAAAWRDEAARWHSPQPPPVQKSLSDTVNLFIGSIELLRGKKLAKGAEIQARVRTGTAPAGARHLDAFDSMRSGGTRELLWQHYDALAQLLLGRTPALAFTRDAPSWGLDDVLLQIGQPRLAAGLAPAVQRTRAVLRALPADPQRWTPAAVRRAAESLAELRNAIDPAVAQALHVTITFTDADGD
jgi:predicted lipoprotein